jgi:hypothetical protein
MEMHGRDVYWKRKCLTSRLSRKYVSTIYLFKRHSNPEQEALRYWTVFPMALPRRSTKDIEYQGATFPAGTTYFMVTLSTQYSTQLPVTKH